jgi:hypothetical protein
MEGTEGCKGGRGLYRGDLLIAMIASRLSRLSLKFVFSRNNDYRDNHIIFSRKKIIV